MLNGNTYKELLLWSDTSVYVYVENFVFVVYGADRNSVKHWFCYYKFIIIWGTFYPVAVMTCGETINYSNPFTMWPVAVQRIGGVPWDTYI